MAISSGQVVVGTTAVGIDGASTNPSHLRIHNMDNTKVLFIGDSNVTVANGFALQKLETLELILNAGEAIFAVSDTGSHTISWLRQSF